MKLAKGVVFFFLMGMMGACFNPPEFPIEPEIGFQSLQFKKSGNAAKDTLILIINFKDGDGDLGINEQDPTFVSYPFHPIDYFLAKDRELIKVSTEKVYDDLPPLIKVDAGQSGKLVTVRTRNNPDYGNLPEYNLYPCISYNYDYDSIYVSEENKSIFDNSYSIIDTITSSNPANPSIYILLDTFYYETNLNHYNITVQFETKNSDGSYSEFDWQKEYCTTFDGRFPVLTENNKVPLEGTLRYDMKSKGFIAEFGGKTIRLKVQIKDRALHLSKPIFTNDVTIN